MKGKFRDPNKRERFLFSVAGGPPHRIPATAPSAVCRPASPPQLGAHGAIKAACLLAGTYHSHEKEARQGDWQMLLLTRLWAQAWGAVCSDTRCPRCTGLASLKSPRCSSFHPSKRDSYDRDCAGGTQPARPNFCTKKVLPVRRSHLLPPKGPHLWGQSPFLCKASSNPGAQGRLPLRVHRGRPSGWA